MLRLQGFSFTYAGAPAPALRDLSLRVGAGEFVVVAGSSGCGKSTLALAAGGYLHHGERGASSGTLLVDGLDVASQPLYAIAERVGLVQQNPENQFCTLHVLDEVAFGLENLRVPPEVIRERTARALELACAAELAPRPLATLSGGQKQRVAVAAMLAAAPRLLVLDEPTAHLDPPTTAALFEALEEIRRETGVTILVLEHKLAYLRRYTPRLVRLSGGRVVADGEPLPSPAPPPPRQPAPAGEVRAACEGLTVAYGAHAALRDLSVTLHGGQLVALMGDNGSGKTTLLRALMGLARPASGRVHVLGREGPSWPTPARAGEVGYLFQNPDHQLLAPTVWEETTLQARNAGCADGAHLAVAEEALQQAGLWDLRDRHPFSLSYGQKRRLTLAAVTAHAPRLLLADEPLIGQDAANAAYVMGRLRAAADEGLCVVAALHDPGAALAYADRVLFLQDGRLLFDAPPREALAALEASGRGAYAEVAAWS